MNVDMQADKAVSIGVDRLVAEVDRAVGRIEQFHRENAELKQRHQTLQEEIARQEKELSKLRAERDRFQKTYEENVSKKLFLIKFLYSSSYFFLD